MNGLKANFKKLIILTLMATVCLIGAKSAWATLSFVKSEENAPAFIQDEGYDMRALVMDRSRSHAPEPTTLAMFGSGLLATVLAFIRRTYRIFKRAFDVTAVLVGAVILSPILLLAAFAVKLTSKGPILYSQVRVGKGGQLFKIFKFRTMKVDAEKETGPVWASANDNRLTPIGQFLRKTHIDELPQLINIFNGEMSLIGPRPERPVFVEQFKQSIPGYENRLKIKPGITGLAQVWHRYDETISDVKKKLKYDLLYIKRMCLWADFNIIMRTFRVVVTGEGAR